MSDSFGDSIFNGGYGTTDGADITSANGLRCDLVILSAVGYIGPQIGPSGDADLITLAANAVTINGAIAVGATLGVTGASTLAATSITALTVSSSATFSGATIANLGTVTTVDINGGTIDGAVIGGTSAAAGTFTTVTASGNYTSASGNITLTAGTLTAGGYIASRSNTYLGDGTNYRALFVDARAGGDFTSDTTKRCGELSNAGSILTLRALNNKSVRVVDDSDNGLTIADGGAATFSHAIAVTGNYTSAAGNITLTAGNVTAANITATGLFSTTGTLTASSGIITAQIGTLLDADLMTLASGALTVNGTLSVTGNVTAANLWAPSWADLQHENLSGTAFTITSFATPQVLTVFDTAADDGTECAASAATDDLTLAAGTYLLNWQVSFDGTGSDRIGFYVYDDGSPVDGTATWQTIPAGGTMTNASGTCIITVGDASVIDLWVVNYTSADDITVYTARLNAVRIN